MKKYVVGTVYDFLFYCYGTIMLKKNTLLVAIICLSAFSLSAQEIVPYYQLGSIAPTSPGAYRFGSLGYSNPAVLSTMNGWQEQSLFANIKDEDDYSYGFFSNSGPFGIGSINYKINDKSVYDTRFNFGMGNRAFGIGVGYSWISGDKSYFNLSNSWNFGMIIRPSEYFSASLHHQWDSKNDNGETVAEIAVRPIPHYPLSLFIDAAWGNYYSFENLDELTWSAGASWEFVDGIRLNGRYFSENAMYAGNDAITVGFDVSLGRTGFAYQSNMEQGDETNLNSHTVIARWSQYKDRTIFDGMGLDKRNKHVIINPAKNPLESFQGYIPFVSFGTSQAKLMTILKKFDKIKKDPTIHTIYLNIRDFALSYEELWEVREKIKEVKETGIKVVIFAENLSMSSYHFASVADEIYLDPLGMMTLEGFAMGRSYYKDMMDKLGVGFEELRLFKYKSAAESFARSEQSEGDREQRQKYIDDIYAFAKQEIADGRDLDVSKIDEYSNTKLFFSTNEAIDRKLIDKVGRWRNIDSIIGSNDKIKIRREGWGSHEIKPMDNLWSEKRKEEIAIVYASGACAMESGIQGRKLAQIMESVMTQDHIKAVVLRVNSPGGSAMASDLVAEVTRKYKGKKPVIVSQASLAASGGYWLSMDADTILAAPMTITGSIGVIAQWVYDKGITDTLGINYYVAKAGKYSDLGQPFQLPLIGIGLPARNLTKDERAQFEGMIDGHYQDFLKAVSEGRGMDSSRVAELAQGRIYSGTHGLEVGLVDEIGGIQKALDIIVEKLGIEDDEDILVREYKPNSGFSLGEFFSASAGIKLKSIKTEDVLKDKVLDDLKMRIENNGKPMYILPYEMYEDLMLEQLD